jgi:hypothetical protein
MFTLHTKHHTEPITLRQLPTLRQAFVVASVIIVLGYVLAWSIDERFIYLPLLVAGGLLVSGTVGVCPMVYLLQLLPWNKSR